MDFTRSPVFFYGIFADVRVYPMYTIQVISSPFGLTLERIVLPSCWAFNKSMGPFFWEKAEGAWRFGRLVLRALGSFLHFVMFFAKLEALGMTPCPTPLACNHKRKTTTDHFKNGVSNRLLENIWYKTSQHNHFPRTHPYLTSLSLSIWWYGTVAARWGQALVVWNRTRPWSNLAAVCFFLPFSACCLVL